jgi:hypothetical protein
VLGVIVLRQVFQDTTRLKDIDRFAVGERISYGGNTAIGINFKEPWLFLLVFAEFELLDFVGEAGDLVSFVRFPVNGK